MTRPKHLGGLGFRDIKLFNLSLLARQSWRLLKEPNSLSARILKDVYYPQSSILAAELGSHPSQIWWSILDGHEILKQGLIKRIGDGRTTKIWSESWLPRDYMMRPMASRMTRPPRWVSELIDETLATWKTELVRQCFLPIDVDVILGIPLCTRQQPNFWAWNYDSKGVFSVRSAYRMMINTKIRRGDYFEGNAGSSNAKTDERGLSSLWKMRVSSKI
jgi:hypothetical protein